MIPVIESIKLLAQDALVGKTCYIKNYDGDMTQCVITRVDMFISKHGVGIKVHLKGVHKGAINYPTCVTLEDYNHDVSYGPVGFMTVESYQKFYL